MKKILVIGSINVDLVYTVNSLPKKGQTIMANNFKTFFGGKGANQAFAISKMNGDVELIGVIGDDEYGKQYLDYLNAKSKMNIGRIKVAKNKATGMATIIVDIKGDNQIIVSPNANFEYSLEIVKDIKLAIDEKDIIILQMEIPLNITKELINYAYDKKKIIILNPAPAVKLEKEILSKIDYLIPNETELEILFNNDKFSFDNIEQHAIDFRNENNVKHLLVTLGEKGSILVDDKFIRVPAKKVNAIDTTCAGDSFLGAFVAMIANDKDEKEAMEFATLVSSIVVSRQGAQDSIPSFDEINNIK